MENIPLPKKVLFEDLSDNKYKVVMEPLYPGYGVTLGNSLRRVMLSSLPGAAVVAVKIKGVDHEFSTIPNVKEDVIEIILNLKQLRLKIHSEGQVRLELTGKDAIDQAAVILMDHFALLGKNNLQAASEMEAPVMDVAVEEGLRTPEEDDLKSLGLSNRSYNALLKNEINKISQLSAMTHEQLMTVEGLGAKSVEEIERLLATYHGSRNT